MILIIRSLPILPEPMIATLVFSAMPLGSPVAPDSITGNGGCREGWGRQCGAITAVASTSIIMPGQASWLTLTKVWVGRGASPIASARHFA